MVIACCVQSVDTVDEARRLRETSDDLKNRAVNTATTIEEGSFTAVHAASGFALLKIKCNVFLFVEVNFSPSVFNINKSI